MHRELRLGTRGSQLALWQANTVKARIAERGGPPCRIVVIKTAGDRLQQAPLSAIGGKRLFVKEIEDALLGDEIDLAVHSSKDMPAVLPEGLTIAGVLPREDPYDAIVLPVRLKADPTGYGVGSGFSRTVATVEDLIATLGQSPSIGTGSVRRIAQLARILPGSRFTPIRGNLDTRLRKLDEGERGSLGNMDALVLAAAGLKRLGFGHRISFLLPAAACVPAPGQGIVAIETRVGDDDVRRAVSAIDEPLAAAALIAERSLVEALGGGCQTPIGALATPEADGLELLATVIATDGSRAIHETARAPMNGARALGIDVAERLLARGAKDILDEAAHQNSHQSLVAGLKSATMTDD